MIAPLLLVVALQTSQPPTPGPAVGAQAPQQQAAPKDTGASSGNAPVASPLGQQQANNPTQTTGQQNGKPSPDWWDWFTNEGANWSIVALTMALTGIGVMQWLATHTANKHNVVIERAYVNASPLPFFINWVPGSGPRHAIKITNTGQTMATIRGAVCRIAPYDRSGIPEMPDYPNDTAPNQSFLLPPSDHIHLTAFPVSGAFGDNDQGRFERADLSLYLFGFIDYEDIFGAMHRVGWARQYFPRASEGERFGIVARTAWSYDRPLTPAERGHYKS
jgi:hypothetical protein